MTLRQSILKLVYPLFLKFIKKDPDRGNILQNKSNNLPPTSIYGLSLILINGRLLSLNGFRGKKILFINTASDCGYTGQYEQLEKLNKKYGDVVQLIAFPSNDFKEQEKGSDEEIEAFCKVNYGITFPLAAKSVVIKSPGQNEVFRWLTHASENGWNDQPPSWNFSKYLVNEEGVLTHYFGPAVSPLNAEVLKAIRES
jgi:glutathione peroxidase